LNAEIKIALDEIASKFDVSSVLLEATMVTPRKSDLKTKPIDLLWMNWEVDDQGIASPIYHRDSR